jgi:hypothetical protein
MIRVVYWYLFSNLYTAVDTPAEAACVENTLVRGGVGT